MSLFRLKSNIRIACAKRLANYLAQEVEKLGFKIISRTETGVDINGTLEDCMYLNMYLRTASRVLFLIDEFEAATPDQLYRNLVEIPWEEYVPEDGYISIGSFTNNENIRDTRFANVRVKDAVVDRLTNKTGKRPDSGPEMNRTVLFLFWNNNQAAIFIDTSGESIAKHGYRKMPFKAPMQEALAAATIMASGWDGSTHFINPMCGSGTLAIEAALIAVRKAPGLMHRNFGFMHVKGFDYNVWKEIKTEAAKSIRSFTQGKIIASDISAVAIGAAQTNAREARVDHLIEFIVCPFEETPIPDGEGVIFINPEYGERLGDVEKLAETYSQIGDFFKKKGAGYKGYIFTGNMDAAKRIGLKTKRRIEFYNATIDCRLLEYELYSGTRVAPKNAVE